MYSRPSRLRSWVVLSLLAASPLAATGQPTPPAPERPANPAPQPAAPGTERPANRSAPATPPATERPATPAPQTAPANPTPGAPVPGTPAPATPGTPGTPAPGTPTPGTPVPGTPVPLAPPPPGSEETAGSAAGGTLLPPDRPITLEDAITIAFRNHANILVAEESLEVARQRVTQARSGTRPNIVGSVAFNQRGTTDVGGVFGPGTGANQTDENARPQVAARQTLFDQGQTRLEVRQARAGVTSATAGVQNAHVNLAFQVTNDYFNLLRAQKLLAVNDEQVRLAEAQLARVNARIEAGEAARSDRAPVETELALARERRIRTLNDVRQAGSALRNSMGLPVGPPPNVVDAAEPEFTIPTLEESLAEAYRRRPDLRQDQANVDIAEANLQLARIRRRPLFSSTAEVNLTPAERNGRGDWGIFTGVSMPIWDAGVTRAREQEASANLGSASARLEQTRKDVSAEVQQALLNLASSRERVEASQASVEAARVALEAATARFEVGLAIPIEVTDAQLDYITAQNSAVTALYDFYIARAQLDRAVGRYRGGSGA